MMSVEQIINVFLEGAVAPVCQGCHESKSLLASYCQPCTEAHDKLFAEMVKYITGDIPEVLARGQCNEEWMGRPKCKAENQCMHCSAKDILDKINDAGKDGV